MRLSLGSKRSIYQSLQSSNGADGGFEPLLTSPDSSVDNIGGNERSSSKSLVKINSRTVKGKGGSGSGYENSRGACVNGQGILKLLVLKLDGTSFDLSVPCSSTVGEMKKILQTTVNELEIKTLGYCDIHWDQVWSNFCLCYMNQKLLDDAVSLRAFGIHSDDQGRMECKLSSNWKVIQGSLDATVKICSGSDESQSPLALQRIPDSGSCEITVEFGGMFVVENIFIASSSRQCEVYMLRAEETEYVCTRRGETDSSGSWYKVELEFADAGSCLGVKVKLLSLVNSNEASVRRMTVRGTPQTAGMPAPEMGTSGVDAGVLKTMMPSVLHMIRGMSNGVGRKEASSSRDIETSSAKEDKTVKVEKRFQDEMNYRLQRLEMAVTGMNSFLQLSFSKLDQRLECLEGQVSVLQHCFSTSKGETEDLLVSTTSIAPHPVGIACEEENEDRVKGHESPELQHEDAQATKSEEKARQECARVTLKEEYFGRDQTEDEQVEEAEQLGKSEGEEVEETTRQESNMSVVEPAVRPVRSISLEDAWTSSLEAFSDSVNLQLVDEKVGVETKVTAAEEMQVDNCVVIDEDLIQVDKPLFSEVCEVATEGETDKPAEAVNALDECCELCDSPAVALTTDTTPATRDLIDWSGEVITSDVSSADNTAESPRASFIDLICENASLSTTLFDSANVSNEQAEVSHEQVDAQESPLSTKLISF